MRDLVVERCDRFFLVASIFHNEIKTKSRAEREQMLKISDEMTIPISENGRVD